VANRVQWLTASLLGARVCYATRPVRSYRLCNSDLWTKRNPVAETCKLNVRLILCSFWYGCHHWTLDVLVSYWISFLERDLMIRALLQNQWVNYSDLCMCNKSCGARYIENSNVREIIVLYVAVVVFLLKKKQVLISNHNLL